MRTFLTIAMMLAVVDAGAQDISIEQRIKNLPILSAPHAAIGYQGSIDKKGGNADWDWFIYEDENHEWVLLDVDGAGIVENFVQHRYPTAPDAEISFYIDHAKKPLYRIKLSEIGSKYPFVEPLAGAYIGPLDGGRGPIRVVRSFVPIPFSTHCKVTSSRKLYGNNLAAGESGWGHIVYHTFDSIPYNRYETKETDRSILKTKGYEVQRGNAINIGAVHLGAGASEVVMERSGCEMISALRFMAYPIDERMLRNVWVRINFDHHEQSDIYCPIGALFGNSFGHGATEYLLMGVNPQGIMYNTFPMPYWQHVKVVIENHTNDSISLNGVVIDVAQNDYKQSDCGYFRNSPYYTRSHTEGRDSRIASVRGYGKMVAAHVTCWAEKEHVISCEGDVRVYIDGKRTPSVQSDGSESYVCYGWGFPTPPESHPFGGYDGKVDNPWSMTRLLVNDYYPFYESLVFDIESGEHNNQYLEHEGAIFYYAQDASRLERVGEYPFARTLKAGESISFKSHIPIGNKGLTLLRQSDQTIGRQEAEVYVDGVKVGHSHWYHADDNPYNPICDDQYEIPYKYIREKKKVEITIRALSTFSIEKLTLKINK